MIPQPGKLRLSLRNSIDDLRLGARLLIDPGRGARVAGPGLRSGAGLYLRETDAGRCATGMVAGI